jgi:hypothetical protein
LGAIVAQVVYYVTAVALGASSRYPVHQRADRQFRDVFAGYVAKRIGLLIDGCSSRPTSMTSAHSRAVATNRSR